MESQRRETGLRNFTPVSRSFFKTVAHVRYRHKGGGRSRQDRLAFPEGTSFLYILETYDTVNLARGSRAFPHRRDVGMTLTLSAGRSCLLSAIILIPPNRSL